MNDFTKNELQYMLELVDSIKIVNRTVNDDELQEKLQSMVDNYCEHKWHPDRNRPWLHCLKCKAIFNFSYE